MYTDLDGLLYEHFCNGTDLGDTEGGILISQEVKRSADHRNPNHN
jgi:hypothetical protein